MGSLSVQPCDLPGAVSDLPNNKHGALGSGGPQWWLAFFLLEFYIHTGWKPWSENLTVCFLRFFQYLDSFKYHYREKLIWKSMGL